MKKKKDQKIYYFDGNWRILEKKTAPSLKSKLKYDLPITSFDALIVEIERFHLRDQQPYWITETKESICIKIEFQFQED